MRLPGSAGSLHEDDLLQAVDRKNHGIFTLNKYYYMERRRKELRKEEKKRQEEFHEEDNL